MVPSTLATLLTHALERRQPLLGRLREEQTNCYRLLHGTQEGVPGVTLDRYGDLALLQTFHAPASAGALETTAAWVSEHVPRLDLVYNDRSEPGSRIRNRLHGPMATAATAERTGVERGVRHLIRARHRGRDPWLFLDLRALRRAVAGDADGRTVLNLCAYTCGVGVAAAVAGATRALNVDFASSSLAVGRANARLNQVHRISTELQSDLFPALRQLAGQRQPTMNRGRRLPRFPTLAAEQFDVVVLDPPRLAKGPFGVVDLLRDYQSLFKPALAVVADEGLLYCTNNVAEVDETTWHDILHRCAIKHGRPIKALDVIRPDADFPSADDRPPLKMVRLRV